MRYALVPACALLLLPGCGRNASEPPQAAITPGGDKKDPAGNPDGPSAADAGRGSGGDKAAQGSGVKQASGTPTAAGPLNLDDPRQTLDWLIRQFAKVRATAPKDQNALEQAWADFAKAARAAEKRKVQWTVPVYAVEAKGVVANWVKSDADPACDGLRVIPDRQPPDRVVLLLQTPDAAKAGQFRSGGAVVVSGVVERIEPAGPGKSAARAKNYGFHVRLSDYRVSPAP